MGAADEFTIQEDYESCAPAIDVGAMNVLEQYELVYMNRNGVRTTVLSCQPDEERIIRLVFDVGPREFWRAARGKSFLDLPPRAIQLELPFSMEDERS